MSRAVLQAAAREAGERFFEDPKGCKHGHTVFYTSNMSCKQCANATFGMTFANYARAEGLTGREREVAEAAWQAAKGDSPIKKDIVLKVIAQTRMTSQGVATALDITRNHASRLLRTLESEGFVKRTPTSNRALLWSLA